MRLPPRASGGNKRSVYLFPSGSFSIKSRLTLISGLNRSPLLLIVIDSRYIAAVAYVGISPSTVLSFGIARPALGIVMALESFAFPTPMRVEKPRAPREYLDQLPLRWDGADESERACFLDDVVVIKNS